MKLMRTPKRVMVWYEIPVKTGQLDESVWGVFSHLTQTITLSDGLAKGRARDEKVWILFHESLHALLQLTGWARVLHTSEELIVSAVEQSFKRALVWQPRHLKELGAINNHKKAAAELIEAANFVYPVPSAYFTTVFGLMRDIGLDNIIGVGQMASLAACISRGAEMIIESTSTFI